MSISDRLDQIEARCDAATPEPWESGPPTVVFSTGTDAMVQTVAQTVSRADAEFITASRTDVPALVAALRAVIDLCELIEKAHAANPKRTYEQGMEVAAHKVRTVIAAALGEGT